MKRIDTKPLTAQSLNNNQTSQINSKTDFNSRQITTDTKSKRKKLIARWLLDENSKLFSQWVSKD